MKGLLEIFGVTAKRRAVEQRVTVDFSELYTQALSNTRYLAASINVISGQIEDLKTRSSRQNSSRIKALVSYRDWLRRKLEEESSDLGVFENNLKKV